MDGRRVDAARNALGSNKSGGWGRRLAGVVALAVLLTIAAPPRAVPPGEGWPMGWLTSIASVRFAFAKDPDVPKQGRGKAPGGHYVSAPFVKDTKKSKPAKGELRAYTPHRPAEATRVAGGSGTGFDRGTSKLVTKDSTARSEIYRNTDGSFTRRVFKDPVNFKAGDGTWKSIDSRLRRTGSRYAVTANSLGISFTATPTPDPLVRFSLGDGNEVAYDLAGATIGQPVVDREVATYRDVLPDVDLELGAQSDAVKETLILKSALAPTEYRFPLRLTGLTPKINKLGGLDLADQGGKTVLTMPLGFLEDAKVDASGSGALGYGVRYSLDGQTLKVSIDGAWLRDPARKFPIKLDPTTRVADSTNDTYVQSNTTTNRVSEDNVGVGTFNGSTYARALLPFPVFGANYAGKNISAATLNVFMSYQGVGTGCVARAFNVNPVTSNWSPGAIPMSSFPSFGASIGSASPSSTAACNNTATTRNVGVWARPGLAVGPLNDWITGGNNYGLALTASETDSMAWKRFTSAEPNLACNHSVWGAIQCDPFIEVTYTDNGVPQIDERYPANNATVPSVTPELVAAGHDVDSFPNKGLRYNFLLYTDQGAQITTSGWTGGTWRVPAGLLNWNKTYIYAVQVNDWSSTGPAAPEPYAFTTQVPQAAVTSSLAQNGGKGFEPNVGNYTNSDTDAQVETTGPALAVTRDYNSLDTRIDGSFAQGWSSILDMAATEAVDGGGVLQTVTVRYPNGQDVAFGRNNDGTFIPPSGRFSVFKTITGGYSLTDKDTTTYEFTQRNGTRLGLTKITDSNGRSLTLRYDANGRPDQMRSVPSNRTLTVAWTQPAGATAFHVETVTTDLVDPAVPGSALVWHYAYDADKLIRVCPPSSATACTTYDYTGASQYVNVTANTSPYLYWRLNEGAGATTAANHEVTADGADAATYSNVTLGAPGPFPGSTATAAQFNGTSSFLKMPEKPAERSGYQSVGMWFKTSTAGGVLLSYQKDVLSAPTTPGSYNPALYVGLDGKLRGEMWMPGATPIISPAPVNDGNWHYAVLAGYGNVQKMYVDGVEAGTINGSIALYNAGLTNVYVGAGYIGGSWPSQPNTSNNNGVATYFNGSLAEVAFYDRAVTGADVSQMYSAGVRPTAELSKITSPGGRVRAQIAFDTVSGRVNQVTDENGGTWGVGAPARGGSSAVYVSSVLGSQPTDYWRLNDTSAPAEARNQALTNRATYHNVTFDTTQPNTTSPFTDSFGGGFNGSSSFVSIDNPDPDSIPATDAPYEGPASVELWFKEVAGTNTSGVLYSYQEGEVNGSAPASGNWTPALYVGNDGYLRGTFWTGSVTAIQSPAPVNDGKWHHVVLSASSSHQTLYLDGNNVGGRDGTMTPTQFSHTYVGGGTTRSWPAATGDVSYFKGNIAEVAYYGRELTEADVDAHFRASTSVVQPGQATTGSTLTPVSTVSVTDPTGKVAKQTFDVINGNRMVASTDTLGNTTTYGYDLGGFESVVYDPIGQKTVTGKDVRGNAIRTEVCHRQGYLNGCDVTYMKYYPDATTTNLTPDPRNDQLTDIREPGSLSETDNTYWTHYDYDTAGNRTRMTGPAVVDFPAGRVTTLTYTDGSTIAQGGGTPPPGLPARVVSPGGAVQTTDYYASGDTFRMTDAGGLATEFTYDGVGRTKSKTVKAGGTVGDLTTTLTYDADGQVTAQVDPPVLNEVTGATHRASTITAYDPDGSVVSRRITDTPEGGDSSRDVTSDYDEHGRMIKTVDPVGLVTLFEYDVYGHKTKTTACSSSPAPGSPCPSGDILKVQSDTYDSEGRQLVTTITDADGNSTKVADRAYYPTGNLASETDAMNWTTKYQYDNSDEPTEITRTDGTRTYVVERNHYLNGKLDEQYTNNGASHKDFEYDQAGRLVRERDGLASGVTAVSQRTTGYIYDGDDHVLTTRFGTLSYGDDDPAQYNTVLGTQTNAYDPMGRVTSSTESTDRASKPSAWWKFNETGGDDYLDSSGSLRNLRDAEPGAGITRSDGAAVINKASFIWDESGPVVDTSKSYTVSAWVKMNNFTTAGSAVAQTGLNTTAVNLGYNKSLNKWAFGAAATDTENPTVNNASSSSALTAGTWVNLVGTFDATSKAMKLYVNGGLGGTATNNTPWQAKAPLSIGWSWFADDQLDGAVDNVQWYERALDASEVTTMFNGGRAGNVTGGTGQLTTRYTVDTRGLTTAMTDPNNNVTRYEYDTIGQLTKEIEPATTVESYGAGAPVSATAVTRYGYNAFGEQTEIQDPLNNTTTTRMDAAGRPVRVTVPDYTPPGGDPIVDAHTDTEYNRLGQVAATVDALGKRTTFAYDIFGNQTKVTDAAGKFRTARYDAVGDLLESVDETGAKATATFDMLNRTLTSSIVVRQPTAQTNTTLNDYGTGAFGTGPWLQKSTSPDGVAVSKTYDQFGQAVTVKDGAGNVTRTDYDGLGQPVLVTNADATKNTTSYDGAGRVTLTQQLDVNNAVLRSESATYDNNGNVLTSRDGRNNTTTFTYDAANRTIGEVQPVTATSSITTSFGYDLAGRQVRYTDGRGNPFWTTYNSWDMPESKIEPPTTAYPDPADRTFTLVYDAAGQTVEQIAPGGVTVTNRYDDRGRLTEQVGAGAEAATEGRTFDYDDAGRMTAFTVPDGTDRVTYDDRGLPLSINGPQDTSSFGYTRDGRMASRTDRAGTTDYTYDNAGRAKTAVNATTGLNLTVTYNSMAQPDRLTYGGTGNARTLTYDRLHRLTGDALKNAAGTTTLGSITYGYDGNDNLTSKVTTGFAGAGSNTYAYDFADRLTSWTSASGTVAYAYDNSGNRTQNGAKTFTYDSRNQLQTQNDGTTYAYTPRGTLAHTVSGSVSHDTTADAFGQVASQAAGGGISRYRYDALGRAVRDGFSYTGLGNDLAKDSEFTYTRDASGALLAEGAGAGTGSVAVWTDRHTDVVGQFTATGTALTGSVTYDPLGVVKAGSGLIGHLGYQSEWTDTITGRVNMLARWYNPDTGQFDTRDTATNNPVPDSVDANRFQYGDANPMTTTDPTGHWGFKSMFKAATNFVANNVVKPAVAVAKAVTAPARAAFNYVASGRAWNDVKKVTKAVAKKATKAWNVVKESTTRWAKKKVNAVKDAYHSAQKCLNKGVSKCAKDTAKAVAKKAVDTVKNTVQAIKEDPWKFIATAAAGIVATVAVGALCATGIGCLILAGAVAGAMASGAGYMVDVARGDQKFSWSGLAGTMIEGGLDGALSAGVSKFTGGLTKGLAKGAARGAGGLAGKFKGGGAPSPVARSHGSGAGPGSPATKPQAGEAPGGRSPSSPRKCRNPHSFEPSTRVLMAGGSTKPIEDVQLGDRVVTTEPRTGRTTDRAVTLLHVNRDTDLADVTVKDRATGRSTTLNTTQTHPFWDVTDRRWVDAGDLIAGHRLRTGHRDGARQPEGDGSGAGLGGGGPGPEVVVTKVVSHTGVDLMRDLTVAEIHTYYVLAGDDPVLVHNCGGDVDGHSTSCDCANGGQPRNADGTMGSNRTRDPDEPEWGSTERRAEWKKHYNDPNSTLTPAQKAVIKARGYAGPQRNNPWTGELETMELSHEPIPFRDGGDVTVPRWPDDHASVDPYRKLAGNRIPFTNTYPDD